VLLTRFSVLPPHRQLIYNYPEQLFADAGVMAIEHADFEGVERLALVTGGEICSTFDSPETVKLGTCDLIEEVIIGEDKLLRFSGESWSQAWGERHGSGGSREEMM